MIRFESNQVKCESLWNQFSPRERAWDEWELMYAFHNQDRYLFQFMVHETGGQIDGLIPLVKDTRDNSYELFGGCYADSRILWIKLEDFQECFEQLPDNTAFFDLNGIWVNSVLELFPEYETNFVEKDIQYFLVPAEFDFDFTNFIHTHFSKDRRKNFLRELRKISDGNPQLTWNDADESEAFLRLNMSNFGEESDYAEAEGQQEVARVIRELQALGYLRTLAIRINGEIEAVSVNVLYNNYWVGLYASSNNKINNLGKFLTVATIQEGCRLRVNEVNYMTGMAWKAAWHMNENPCRTMRKPAKVIDDYFAN